MEWERVLMGGIGLKSMRKKSLRILTRFFSIMIDMRSGPVDFLWLQESMIHSTLSYDGIYGKPVSVAVEFREWMDSLREARETPYKYRKHISLWKGNE